MPIRAFSEVATTWARRLLQRSALAAAAVGLASCLVSPTAESPRAETGVVVPPPANTKDPVVVVVALDGVRWQDVFEGVDPELARKKGMAPHEVLRPEQLMPNLNDIVWTRGAALGAPGHGAAIYATGPNFVSLPGYAEMLSGAPSPCQSNECEAESRRTLADDFADVSHGWAGEVAVVASWPDLARVAARRPDRILVSAGRHAGANQHLLRFDAESTWLLDAGAREKPYPGHGDFRPDRYTAALALRYLRQQKPRFLFLSLGEPDAYAHRGLYRQYLRSLSQADVVIGEIDQYLSTLRARGERATLFVTTDHGRGKRFAGHGGEAPESARVWMVATGSGIGARGWIMAPRLRHLADLAPTVRRVAGLVPEAADGGVIRELLAPSAG
jgi:hypothetical protein